MSNRRRRRDIEESTEFENVDHGNETEDSAIQILEEQPIVEPRIEPAIEVIEEQPIVVEELPQVPLETVVFEPSHAMEHSEAAQLAKVVDEEARLLVERKRWLKRRRR
jgi:hypothetical protein